MVYVQDSLVEVMNEILQSEPSQTLRLHSMDLFSRSSIFIGTQQLDTLVSQLVSDLSVTLDVCSPLYYLIFVGCFTCVSDGFKLVCWGSIVEWRSLILKANNSTGHRWDSNPGPCR